MGEAWHAFHGHKGGEMKNKELAEAIKKIIEEAGGIDDYEFALHMREVPPKPGDAWVVQESGGIKSIMIKFKPVWHSNT